MAFTYVLRSSKDNKLYIGSTENLNQRLEEHNSGKCKSTKPRRPLKIVYKEYFDSISDARLRERQFKRSHSILYKAASWDDRHK